jgi:nitrogen regulatory protein PII
MNRQLKDSLNAKIKVPIAGSAAHSDVRASAKTGKIGDGKVFISTTDEVVRILSDEEGEQDL